MALTLVMALLGYLLLKHLTKTNDFLTGIFKKSPVKIYLIIASLLLSFIIYETSQIFIDFWLYLWRDLTLFLLLLAGFIIFQLILQPITFYAKSFYKEQGRKLPYKRLIFSLNFNLFLTVGLIFILNQRSVQFSFIETKLWQIGFFFIVFTLLALPILTLNHFAKIIINFNKNNIIKINIIKVILWPLNLLFLSGFSRLIAGTLSSDNVSKFFNIVTFCSLVAASAYLLYAGINLLQYYFVKLKKINDSLISLAALMSKITIIFSALLLIISRISGQSLTGVMAALGIGGLAIALASQDLLKNLIGGIAVMLDKPFKLGENISALGFSGKVEEIGFRSTRIRTAEGFEVNLPNSSVSSSPISNNDKRLNQVRNFNLHLSYDNPPEALNKALTIIKTILDEHKNELDPVQGYGTSFSEFKDWALAINIYYSYINFNDKIARDNFNQLINFKIIERFEQNNIKLAVAKLVY